LSDLDIGDEKNARNLKTTVPASVAPQDVVPRTRKPGGQPGNSNAFKTGRDTAEARHVRRACRDLRRRANAAVAHVDAIVKERRLARRAAAQDDAAGNAAERP
jgi:hypothetical protein